MHYERRSMPRADTLFRVECRNGDSALFAHDVSLGGLFVTTRGLRQPGQLIPVRFQLPNQARAICVTTRVIDLSPVPEGVGLNLAFLKLSAEARLALHRYIDSRPVVAQDESLRSQASAWVERLAEDCAELLAFARA